jgi:hypothetical protein
MNELLNVEEEVTRDARLTQLVRHTFVCHYDTW